MPVNELKPFRHKRGREEIVLANLIKEGITNSATYAGADILRFYGQDRGFTGRYIVRDRILNSPASLEDATVNSGVALARLKTTIHRSTLIEARFRPVEIFDAISIKTALSDTEAISQKKISMVDVRSDNLPFIVIGEVDLENGTIHAMPLFDPLVHGEAQTFDINRIIT